MSEQPLNESPASNKEFYCLEANHWRNERVAPYLHKRLGIASVETVSTKSHPETALAVSSRDARCHSGLPEWRRATSVGDAWEKHLLL
jgi:hypothetical protein